MYDSINLKVDQGFNQLPVIFFTHVSTNVVFINDQFNHQSRKMRLELESIFQSSTIPLEYNIEYTINTLHVVSWGIKGR